jgi:ATP-dependent exoDNAse (exonuclease V) beta subunit
LKEQGIPVSSSDSLLLYGSDNVHLLLNLLQFVHGKKQAKADLYVLHHVLERFQEPLRFHELASLYHKKGASVLWNLLKEKDIRIDLKLHHGESIYESAERLCRETWLEESDPFVQEFMNLLMAHSRNADSSLDGFMEEFERSKWKWSISAAPSEDAVQLMTIHRSKGLQFPVVILPYWKSKTRANSPKEWFPWDNDPFAQVMLPLTGKLENSPFAPALQREKELQAMDELNLLYVACTRPEERLYMTMVEEGPLVSAIKEHLEPNMEGTCCKEGKAEQHTSKTTPKDVNEHRHLPKADPKILLRTTAKSESLYSKEREFGKLVHSILEKNERLEDVPSFIDQLSSGLSLDTDQLIDLERSVKAALRTESELKLEEKGFFCYKEQDILSPDGTVNRLDRLYLNPTIKAAVILDFKTGKPDKKDEKQMRRYQDLLMAMGYSNTEAYLLYTQNAELVKVQS